MPRIRTITFSARGVLDKAGASELEYATRAMASLVCKSLKLKSKAGSLLSIELVEDESLQGEQFWEVGYSYNIKMRICKLGALSFLQMDAVEQSRTVVGWLCELLSWMQANSMIEGATEPELSEFLKAAEQLEYRNVYLLKTPVRGQKGFAAQIEIDHGADGCIGSLIIWDSQCAEIAKKQIFSTKPDELLFRQWFVTPIWSESNVVTVTPESWSLDSPKTIQIEHEIE